MTVRNDVIRSTSKRLPIVLCLDVSPSMTMEKRMENLNAALKVFYKELQSDNKAVNAAEIAIVTFSTDIIENGKKFEPLSAVVNRTFKPVEHGGSQISKAILYSIQIIEDRLALFDSSDIDHYLPFLVVVTDGDPDGTDNSVTRQNAIQSVLRHCETSGPEDQLIAPYIIGVGNDISQHCATLNQMASKFTGSAILVNGNVNEQNAAFKELFAFIGNSVKNSLAGANNLKGLYEGLRRQATDKNIEITERRRGIM